MTAHHADRRRPNQIATAAVWLALGETIISGRTSDFFTLFRPQQHLANLRLLQVIDPKPVFIIIEYGMNFASYFNTTSLWGVKREGGYYELGT